MGNQEKDSYPIRRRNMSPKGKRLDYDDDPDSGSNVRRRQNSITRGTRYHTSESDEKIRRMSPRRQHLHSDT